MTVDLEGLGGRIGGSKVELLDELKELLRMRSVSARGGDKEGFRGCTS
jgi:hypothetical protein